MRYSSGDRVFQITCFTFLFLSGVVILVPLLYVMACSFSSTEAIVQGRVFLWPVEPSLRAYSAVFQYRLLGTGFLNSIIYVAGGTSVAVALLLVIGYPLSRKDLPCRKVLQTFFVITMFFGGGIIPTYMLMRSLHLIGSRLSLIIGVGFSCYNMIIVKTYFQTSLSTEILDAAHIDGCGDVSFFFRIAIPLATPVIAVMVLFNAVGIWNGYFNGMLYLTKSETFNFQMILRDILFVAQMPPELVSSMDPNHLANMRNLLQQLKYSVLVVGALPMMLLYPFIQKFFIKGMMLGSIKE